MFANKYSVPQLHDNVDRILSSVLILDMVAR